MKKNRTAILFSLSLLIIVSLFSIYPPVTSISEGGQTPFPHEGSETISWHPSLYSQWNYRVKVTLTEPGIADRINEPVSVYLSMPSGMAKENSFRTAYYANDEWYNVTTQVWNVTKDAGGWVTGATITFIANVSKSSTRDYYIYFTNEIVADPDYDPLVRWVNDTGVNGEKGTAYTSTYSASVLKEYGYLVDLNINSSDGESGDLWGSKTSTGFERGVIAWWYFYQSYYEDARPESNTAIITELIEGPAFVRVTLYKDTYYYHHNLTRIFTFYPNYFTMELIFTPNPGVSKSNIRYFYYNLMHHNGSGNPNVIGSKYTLNYTSNGADYVKTVTIDGVYDSGLYLSYIQPNWVAVYKDNVFSYSCVPINDENINGHYYYDLAGYNPPLYGWGSYRYYSSSGITGSYYITSMAFTVHEGNSNPNFAIMDREKLLKPLEASVSDIEFKWLNEWWVNVRDYEGNPVSDIRVELLNGSTSVSNKTTDSNSRAIFED
ncbi:MAG: hypothetical protein ACTSYR_03295, partial [Candidatus Odinarchaeia archaeon]